MEEKSLIERKESIFTKLSNFVKKLFYRKNKAEENGNDSNEKLNVNKNNAESIQSKEEYQKSLDIEFQKIVEAYNKYENHELELSELSYEELENLNKFYDVKIADLSKKQEEIIRKIILVKDEINSFKNLV